jgi:urease accessory protein
LTRGGIADGNRYGKRSEFTLRVRGGGAARRGAAENPGDAGSVERAVRPVIETLRFTAPFKALEPFYGDDGGMKIMLISVSAGIMAGDSQRVEVSADTGARLEIVSQSFEKIHRMDDGGAASREIVLSVGAGALLIYSPLPTIPFAGSDFTSATRVHLQDSSARLVYGDVLACGRAFSGERFRYRAYRNGVYVTCGGSGAAAGLLYADNACFIPSEADMEGLTLFEGYSHLSNLLLFNVAATSEQCDEIRAALSEFPGIGGMTRLTQAPVPAAVQAPDIDISPAAAVQAPISAAPPVSLCVRTLANGSEPALALHERIRAILDP